MKLWHSSTALEVRAILLKNGDTLAGWARKHGYKPIHAARYLARWSGRASRPIGAQTRAVIEALEKDTGVRICGAQAEAETAKEEATEWQARM